MSDRLQQQQQFNMLQNFNPSLLQHQIAQGQQQPQQPQQPLDGQPRQPQTFPHPDAARLWQQMQHLSGQQFRPQNGVDTQMPQANQQMADMMRNRAQQAVQGQPQNLPFAMNASSLAGQNQFGAQNNGMGTQPHLNANISPHMNMLNRAAMLQATNQGHMRQLELLNQQNQSGAVNFNRLTGQQPPHQTQPGMNPQPGQAQPTQNDLFASPAMTPAEAMRASPAHPQPNAAVLGQPQQQPQQQPPIQLRELVERIRQNRETTTACKTQLDALQSNRGNMTDAMFQSKMAVLRKEMHNREEMHRKLLALYQQMTGGRSMPPAMLPMTMGQPGTTAPTATQPAWMNPQPNMNNRPHFNSGVLGQVSASPPNVQPSPSQIPAQSTPMMGSAGIPPRSGPTPLQGQPPMIQNQFSGQHISNPTPADGGQLANGQQMQRPMLQMQMPPPLDKAKFDEMFVTFCRKMNLQVDNNLLSITGRTLDLHELHKAVLEVGGVNKVATQDLWPVVGARLGFVQFPGNETEPARAGPQIAQRLQHIYKEYLFQFDKSYVTHVIEMRRKLAEQQQKQLPVMPANAGINRMQMQATMMYAHVPAAQLRQQGVPEQTIQFVEAHRALLQRYQADQNNFREQLKIQQQQQQQQQPQPPPQPQPPQSQQVQPQVSTGLEAEKEPTAGPSTMTQNPGGNAYPTFGRPLAQATNMMAPGAGPQIPGKSFLLATQQERAEMITASNQMIQRLKEGYMANHSVTINNYDLAPEQRIGFGNQIEGLHRIASDLDSKLAIIALLGVSEEQVKQLVSLFTLIYQQRALLSTNPPRYILDPANLLHVRGQILRAKDFFDRQLAQQQQHRLLLMQQQQQAQQQAQQAQHQQQQQQAAAAASLLTATDQTNLAQRPPSATASVTSPQPESLIQNRVPSLQPPPPARLKLAGSSPASHPTPPASAPTPVASASSPAHPELSSHSITKSPKPKPVTKRPPASTASIKRRPSKAQPPAPGIKSETSEGSPGSSLKRQREDETTPAIANTPSPKRPKVEEQPPVAGPSTVVEPEPTIKQEEVDNIKSEEQASEFLQNLTELLERAGELNEGLNADISEKLDDILKNVPPAGESILRPFTDMTEASTFSSGSNQRESISDEFIDFFDFSSFPLDEDDAGSKAVTPDLVSSSSTNTSPDSSSDSDAAHGHVGEAAVGDASDFLRLGFWKDIDGGESSYYTGTQGDWDWSKPMPTKDQPWPISI